MNDRDLNELLNRLPRERASLGFKTRVLARLEEPRAAVWHRLQWGLVGAAIVALLGGGLLWRDRQDERREEIAANRLETLRSEYSELEGELRQIRRLVAAAEPVVGVDGNGEYDYVLDLQQITRASGGALPVAYRPPE